MHLYIHIPFCAAKCPYCDFPSCLADAASHAAYVSALLDEISRLPRGPYETLFIGGGTPSLLGPSLLQDLCIGIRRHCQLKPGYEWSIEANPASGDMASLQAAVDQGVNRISLGIQSFQPALLAWLGRIHDRQQAIQALRTAQGLCARVSCDLMLGLPGQDSAQLSEDLNILMDHGLQHCSLYALSIEEGTAFAQQAAQGRLTVADEEATLRLLDCAEEGLAAAGLALYETSNFAVPGEECRHNLAYWQHRDYYAAGAGAVSCRKGLRQGRQPDPWAYCRAIDSGQGLFSQEEVLSPHQQLVEHWMLGLRLSRGIDPGSLSLWGDRPERWQPLVRNLVSQGLLLYDADSIRLSKQGRRLQDRVTLELIPDPP